MRVSFLEVMDGGDGDEEIGRLQDLRGLDDADHRILPFGCGVFTAQYRQFKSFGKNLAAKALAMFYQAYRKL